MNEKHTFLKSYKTFVTKYSYLNFALKSLVQVYYRYCLTSSSGKRTESCASCAPLPTAIATTGTKTLTI